MIKLSVIIPARNEHPNLPHTIYSILHCWEADGFDFKEIEIIVVDNCSEDQNWAAPKPGDRGTSSYLLPRGAFMNRVVRVLYDPIAGNHSARNKGAEIARGEYLFFSDAHVAYKPGFFKSILKAVDESGGIVHGTLQNMGAYPPVEASAGYGYTLKLGEEIKGCVDEDTEILTNDGWKKWNEVSMESEFATVNMTNHEIEFQKPRDIVIRQHNGVMVKITGRSYDALLTPYHRTIYQTNGVEKWRIKEAIQISSTDKLPLGTAGIQEKNNVYSDELVELIGWIITEGSFREDGSIVVTQYGKENRNRIERLIKSLGLTYFKKKRGDFVINVNPSKPIRKLLPKKELTFSFVNSLNRRQMDKLYRVMIDADGTHNNNGHESFIQVNQTTIDAFQYLCVLIGKQSKWFTKKPEVFKGNHFGKKDIQVVSVKKNKRVTNFKKELVSHKGIVWCPDLSNGTIFCRRNGHTYPSAQTWNNYCISNKDWFYVTAQGHWAVCVKKKQFLDFGGYPKIHRTYGGGEFYLNMKWWMFGSTVAVDPQAIGYHLASARGYGYHHNDYKENVLGMSYALGMDDWRERAYLNWMRQTAKKTMDEIMERSAKEHQSDREFVEKRRKKTFNELILERPWEKLNKEKHGRGLVNILVYHNTWIDLLKKTPIVQQAF